MYDWDVSIEVWPHSTGKGADEDQKAAGARARTIRVKADSIGIALRLAQLFADGVKTNPAVWQVPIMRIARAHAVAAPAEPR